MNHFRLLAVQEQMRINMDINVVYVADVLILILNLTPNSYDNALF